MAERRWSIRRLVVGHIAAFGLVVLALCGSAYLVARQRLVRALDERISARLVVAQQAWREGGQIHLLATLNSFAERGGHFTYAVRSRDGRELKHVDGIDVLPPGWGFATFSDRDDGNVDPVRTRTARLPDGTTVTIVADRDYIVQFDTALIAFLCFASLLMLLMASLGGLSLEAAIRARLRQVNDTAVSIIGGDLNRRVVLAGTGDEFDALSTTVNRMLDRVQALIDDVRRISAYVAHDIREPLATFSQNLRANADDCVGGAGCAGVLREAASTCDGVIDLVGTILQIGELDDLRVRSAGGSVDLSDLVAMLADSYTDVADGSGRSLHHVVEPGVVVFGMRDLLAQALVNILENAVAHTPLRSRIEVSLESRQDLALLVVSDDGPSLAEGDLTSVLERGRTSNSRPAHEALGLKLVRAIVAAHGGSLTITDAAPGFRVVVEMPLARRSA